MAEPVVLRVAGQAPSCTPVGGGRIELRPVDGRIRLPQIEAVGSAMPELSIVEVRTASAPLADVLRTEWLPDGSGSVDAAALFAPLASATPLEAAVRWLARPHSHPADEEFEFIVDLTVVPASSTLHPGFVAIDFGSSNTTATLHDPRSRRTRALAVTQMEALRTGLCALIGAVTRPDRSGVPHDQLLSAVHNAAADVLGPDASNGDAAGLLVAALEAENLDRAEDPLLFRVALALEHERSAATGPLADWLTDRIDAAYDAAFATPALDRLNLQPVALDGASGAAEVASRVEVTSLGDPLTVRMGDALTSLADPDADPDTGPAAPATGVDMLKQYLGKPTKLTIDDGAGTSRQVDTDELLAAAIRFVVHRTDQVVTEAAGRVDRGRLDRVVATYPTVAPPLARAALRRLVADRVGIGNVDMDYDEAVAAVLFFLMRDLGGELTHVVESVRTRFARIDRRTWQQNVLVIDVGGGTTDIALVTLTLRDDTPPVPDSDEAWRGRYYTLKPEVRGSTGHLQLGGEYLTLRIFRWVKAVAADRLLVDAPAAFADAVRALPEDFKESGTYRPGSLVAAALGASADDDPAFAEVEKVLPTRWAEAQGAAVERARETFRRLWTIAEETKKDLGARPGRSAGITAEQLAQVLRSCAPDADDGPGLHPAELDQATFDALLGPPLREVVRLATELAVPTLAGSGGKLGRIVLTGRSSRLRQLREHLLAELGRIDGEQRLNWHAGDVVVETEYAKLATSLGAAWAASIRRHRFEAADAVPKLRQGVSQLWVDIRNLSYNLPCTFSRGSETPEYEVDLLGAGTLLQQIDADEVVKARTDWLRLDDAFDVNRMIGRLDKSLWATFQWDRPHHGLGSGRGVWPSRIRVMLEVDQDLNLSLLVRHDGTAEHHVVPAGGRPIRDALVLLGLEETAYEDGRLVRLPADVVVNAGTSGSGENTYHPVFTEGEFVPDRVFHSAGDPSVTDGRSPLPSGTAAVLGTVDLPPTRDGWTFDLLAGDHVESIGWLERPTLGTGQIPTRYRASLTADGTLRVHAGELAHPVAETLVDVENCPGRVHRAPMELQAHELDEYRNPFNGRH